MNHKSRSGIILRAATPDDALLLYGWLNDPDRIVSSLQTTKAVPLDQHLSWFAARLADPECRIWVLETAEGPSGQLRLEGSVLGAEVSIYVAKKFRGRGIAAAALAEAAAHARKAYNHGRLLARIRRDNSASIKLFHDAGFAITDEFDDHFLFSLETSITPKEAD